MTGEINWTAGAHFLTIHNVHYQLSLMAQIRDAIKMDQFSEFVQDFFRVLYHGEQLQYPKWAVDALRTVGINILEESQTASQE